MKTRYACAALLCFVPWIICTGCGLWDKLAAPKPSKGEMSRGYIDKVIFY